MRARGTVACGGPRSRSARSGSSWIAQSSALSPPPTTTMSSSSWDAGSLTTYVTPRPCQPCPSGRMRGRIPPTPVARTTARVSTARAVLERDRETGLPLLAHDVDDVLAEDHPRLVDVRLCRRPADQVGARHAQEPGHVVDRLGRVQGGHLTTRRPAARPPRSRSARGSPRSTRRTGRPGPRRRSSGRTPYGARRRRAASCSALRAARGTRGSARPSGSARPFLR